MRRPTGVADVAVSWTDEAGTKREGRIRVAAQGLPVGWAVELLAAGATGAGITVATDSVETAQAPQVVTRPRGDRARRPDVPVRLTRAAIRGDEHDA